jgi:hypothetical protein
MEGREGKDTDWLMRWYCERKWKRKVKERERKGKGKGKERERKGKGKGKERERKGKGKGKGKEKERNHRIDYPREMCRLEKKDIY